jgi:hypothetical protein
MLESLQLAASHKHNNENTIKKRRTIMSNEEAEAIMNFYSDRDNKEERHNFLSRMERKMHRKEQRAARS